MNGRASRSKSSGWPNDLRDAGPSGPVVTYRLEDLPEPERARILSLPPPSPGERARGIALRRLYHVRAREVEEVAKALGLDVERIRRMAEAGWTLTAAADHLGVTPRQLYQFCWYHKLPRFRQGEGRAALAADAPASQDSGDGTPPAGGGAEAPGTRPEAVPTAAAATSVTVRVEAAAPPGPDGWEYLPSGSLSRSDAATAVLSPRGLRVNGQAAARLGIGRVRVAVACAGDRVRIGIRRAREGEAGEFRLGGRKGRPRSDDVGGRLLVARLRERGVPEGVAIPLVWDEEFGGLVGEVAADCSPS